MQRWCLGRCTQNVGAHLQSSGVQQSRCWCSELVTHPVVGVGETQSAVRIVGRGVHTGAAQQVQRTFGTGCHFGQAGGGGKIPRFILYEHGRVLHPSGVPRLHGSADIPSSNADVVEEVDEPREHGGVACISRAYGAGWDRALGIPVEARSRWGVQGWWSACRTQSIVRGAVFRGLSSGTEPCSRM